MTIAEKIRICSNDELAEWLTKFYCDAIVQGFQQNGINVCCPDKSKTRAIKLEILKYLQEEVKTQHD